MLPSLQLRAQKRQRRFYSGKKKRHALKTQLVVDKQSLKVICTTFTNGKRHDFSLFKESGVHCLADVKLLVDTGYPGYCEDTGHGMRRVSRAIQWVMF